MLPNRVPPHDLTVEQALIGAVLLNPDYIQRDLPSEAFYSSAHREIWSAILALVGRGDAVDEITVFAALRERGSSIPAATVSGMTHYCASADHAEVYAQKLLELHARRRVIVEALTAAQKAYDLDSPLLETVTGLAKGTQEAFVARQEPVPLRAALADLMDDLEAKHEGGGDAGLSTGYADVDKHCRMYPGDLIVLAGRPGMGKTGAALDICLSAAEDGKKVALFSLEMPKRAIAARLTSKLSGVNGKLFRTANFTDSHWPKIAHALGRGADLPIWIDDTCGVSTAYIRAQAERVAAKGGLDLVVVDYLGLIREPGRWENREVLLLGTITKALKRMAKEMGLPVIVLSQLNRGVESRKPPRPMLSDLRQSGEIEQDADGVWMLYRPEYYTKDETPPEDQGIGWFLIEKSREGETGAVKLLWAGETTSYKDWARGPCA